MVVGYVAPPKGTLSEAETHVLRTRLHQGKLNKARRGELFTCVPIGYVRSADGGIALDPDEQVRSVVAMVFGLFAELGSIPKVQAHLVAHGRPFCKTCRRNERRGPPRHPPPTLCWPLSLPHPTYRCEGISKVTQVTF